MAFLIRALAALLASTTRHVVLGCSCAPHGDTPTEQAESIRTQSDWIDFYAIATFVNETQYSVDEFWGSDDDDPYETTHQNTTFILKEIVYNPSGELPSTIEIKSDGTIDGVPSLYRDHVLPVRPTFFASANGARLPSPHVT